MPFERALADSSQVRVYLHPPALRGDQVLSTRTRIGKQLVEDMGGHGRALEALTEVLQAHNDQSLEEMDPTILFDKVCEALQRRYGEIFDSPLFRDAKACQEVLVGILLCRTFGFSENIAQTNLTVDELHSFGLFRLTRDDCLSCPFILLVMLMRKISKQHGGLDNFDEHFTCSVLVWQPFEQLVALHHLVKSIAYREIPVHLSRFHYGAHFGPITFVVIKELNSRTIVEAVRQHDTKSGPKIQQATQTMLVA